MPHTLPQDYIELPGSERHPIKGAKIIGPADESETFQVILILRRRTDGPAIPDFDHYAKTPPGKRNVLSPEVFADEYGAHPNEIKRIVQFLENAGLTIVETHAGRRSIKASGTVTQMSNAFAVRLHTYEYTLTKTFKKQTFPFKATHRGMEGFIHVPSELVPLIIGVFGLDNRKVGRRAGLPADDFNFNPISINQIKQLYNFPSPGPSIQQQTIGIIAPFGENGGYLRSDLDLYFNSLGLTTPANIYSVSIDYTQNTSFAVPTAAPTPSGSNTLTFASTNNIAFFVGSMGILSVGVNTYPFAITEINSQTTITVVIYYEDDFEETIPAGTMVYFNLDYETTQDICIAASASGGANIAVYYSDNTEWGWIDLIGRAIQPSDFDLPLWMPPPSILTTSWMLAIGDDTSALYYSNDQWNTGVTSGTITALDMIFQDAAIHGITVCAATGDYGSNSQMDDHFAHVSFPASDPWILSVGGTTMGKYQPLYPRERPKWIEYVWNDTGATGGGISDYFPVPSYQQFAEIPENINFTHDLSSGFNETGRGVPDVAANASPESGYPIFVGGQPFVANGTSSSTPLWASLIAILNSNLGVNLGFINPIFYGLGNACFNPINPLWRDPDISYLADCPANNGYAGIYGYPANAGWDACTGLGSPNGNTLLTYLKMMTQPDVYVLGGYQSPSLLIIDPDSSPANQPVPIGTFAVGGSDTQLKPGIAYGLGAVVNNDSPILASNIEIRFWGLPNGEAKDGYMIGTPQILTIPASSSITVYASAPLVSAPDFHHLGVAVSIFSPTTGCMTQALDSTEIPDPGQEGSHSCAAFRNTDSFYIPQFPWRFSYSLPFSLDKEYTGKPLIVQIQSTHIPCNWKQLASVSEITDVLKSVGVENKFPLYLLPQINKNFQNIDLGMDLGMTGGGWVEKTDLNYWRVIPVGDAHSSLTISGDIPAYAKTGDMIVMKLSTQYPETTTRKARTIDFYVYIHVGAGPQK